MNGWEAHLTELRRRIIAVLAVFFTATVIAFVFSSRIAAFLTAPLDVFNVKLYTFAPAEKFMAYMRLSMWTGVVFTTPFFCLQAGFFLWPGLRGNEYRYAVAVLLVVPVLFLFGAGLCYRFIAPIVFEFFLSFGAGDGVESLWNLREYLALLFGLMIATGLLLQLPLGLLALIVSGAVSAETIAHYRPHIIFMNFVLATLLTPPDVASQIMLAVPLCILFEGALWFGRLLRRGKSHSSM